MKIPVILALGLLTGCANPGWYLAQGPINQFARDVKYALPPDLPRDQFDSGVRSGRFGDPRTSQTQMTYEYNSLGRPTGRSYRTEISK